MTWVVPSLPPGWRVQGGLPPVEPAAARDDEISEWGPDMFVAEAPDAAHVLAVGWRPEASRAGHFVLKLVRDEDWQCPLEVLTTDRLADAIEWVVASAQNIGGQRGAAPSDDAVPLDVLVPILRSQQPPTLEVSETTANGTITTAKDRLVPSAKFALTNRVAQPLQLVEETKTTTVHEEMLSPQ